MDSSPLGSEAHKAIYSIWCDPMSKTDPVEIRNAEYVQEYKIRLKFGDGKERVVHFEPFLLSARNPTTPK